MSNLITEGYDWFPTGLSASERTRLWAANGYMAWQSITTNPFDVVTGSFGFGKALSCVRPVTLSGAGEAMGYVIPILDELDEGFLGFRFFKGSRSGPNWNCGLGFFDAVDNKHQLFVEFWAYGIIRIWRGHPGDFPAGTVIAHSPAGSFEEDEWFHVEVKPLIADSGGEIEVRVNTVPKVQLTGADTQTSTHASFDSVSISYSRGTVLSEALEFRVDDMFVNNLAGATCNDWLGNVRSKGQFMIANGFTDNFTIGGTSPAATNWQSVLNNSLDDTKFVYSPVVGDIDLYTPDPNLNSPIVHVVQIRMGLRQDDATQRVARAVIRIGGTNYVHPVDQYTNQTFTFYKSRFEVNPATTVVFTGAEVNGIQAGVKVQA